MGTTVEKLNKVLETKEAIRTAINNKGGTLTTSDTFASYSSAIDSLPSGSGEDRLKKLLDTTKSTHRLFYEYKGTSVNDLISYNDTENVTDMRYMFQDAQNILSIPELNTNSVTDMNSIFSGCSNLTTIPQLDTSNVTNMSNMFYNCQKLTTIPLLDTSNVTKMNYMFQSCSNLTTIPQLNTNKVTSMSCMFTYCYNLVTIDITHMKITSTSNSNQFALNCHSLTKLIIRNMTTIPTLNSNSFNRCFHFTGTIDATYNPNGLKDGRIYVPDDKVKELKVATNWSVYADIIVPLSTLVE